MPRLGLRIITAAAILVAAVFLSTPSAHAVTPPNPDIVDTIAAADGTSAGMEWMDNSQPMTLIERMRGFGTVILLIALIASALVAGTTGRSTMALFVAVGSVVLYGGFWIVLLIIEGLGSGPPASAEVVVTPPDARTVADTVLRDFVNYGMNMLTTAVLPFALIYGFWMSLGIAYGDSDGATSPSIRNYMIGGIVAVGASIFTQIFFRW